MELSDEEIAEIEEDLDHVAEEVPKKYLATQKYSDEVFEVIAEGEEHEKIYEPMFARRLQEKGADIEMEEISNVVSVLDSMNYDDRKYVDGDYIVPALNEEEAAKYAEEFYIPNLAQHEESIEKLEE